MQYRTGMALWVATALILSPLSARAISLRETASCIRRGTIWTAKKVHEKKYFLIKKTPTDHQIQPGLLYPFRKVYDVLFRKLTFGPASRLLVGESYEPGILLVIAASTGSYIWLNRWLDKKEIENKEAAALQKKEEFLFRINWDERLDFIKYKLEDNPEFTEDDAVTASISFVEEIDKFNAVILKKADEAESMQEKWEELSKSSIFSHLEEAHEAIKRQGDKASPYDVAILDLMFENEKKLWINYDLIYRYFSKRELQGAIRRQYGDRVREWESTRIYKHAIEAGLAPFEIGLALQKFTYWQSELEIRKITGEIPKIEVAGETEGETVIRDLTLDDIDKSIVVEHLGLEPKDEFEPKEN